mgnify:CR=1 FL=1
MKTKFISFIFLLNAIVAFGQDIHFSQMRFSPLNLNPALAGVENKLQAIVNYRNQWGSIAEPFETIGASFDFRFKEKSRANGFFAGGINFFNDAAGNANLTSTNANLNLAYHLYLNRNSTLGLSIQGGFGQRGISPRNGTWSTQFVGDGFNTNAASGEQFDANSRTFLDAGAGMVYHYKSKSNSTRRLNNREINVGLAAFHVNMPQQSFLLDGNDPLAIRWSAFVHGNYSLSNSKVSLMPGIYYNRQGKYQEVLGGTYIRTLLSESSQVTGFLKEAALSFGLFYRLKDAFITKLMFEYNTFAVGFAYDFNVSSLTPASRGRGGAELFIRFVLPDTYLKSRARIN